MKSGGKPREFTVEDKEEVLRRRLGGESDSALSRELKVRRGIL